MASADVGAPPTESAPSVPDYVLDPNAVLKDSVDSWRYGRAPDYSKTRKYWQETKTKSHTPGSLEAIAENLVKNWEVEASFKTSLSDWRTIDHSTYTFAMNGGPPQTGEHMLKVGTYNAIIAPNEYYSPATSDFSSSHKTFKRMMPTFAWEVLEVYSGPPKVAFRWRHWGVMKNDYVGFNEKGEKVTAKSHGGTIDIQGVTVAQVDDKLRVQTLETWFDSMDMFRQIAPNGIVNKEIGTNDDDEEQAEKHEGNGVVPPNSLLDLPDLSVAGGVPENSQSKDDSEQAEKHEGKGITSPNNMPDLPDLSVAGGVPESSPADERAASANPNAPDTTTTEPATCFPGTQKSIYTTAVTGSMEPKNASATLPQPASPADKWDEKLAKPSLEVHPFPKKMEENVKPRPGDTVVAKADSEEARKTYEEMSRVTPMECPFMNKE